jgi:phi LC3 family holin
MKFKWERLRHLGFWTALGALLLLLLPQFGVNIVPEQFEELYAAILAVLIAAGIIIDPTTPGISDETNDSE